MSYNKINIPDIRHNFISTKIIRDYSYAAKNLTRTVVIRRNEKKKKKTVAELINANIPVNEAV